MDRKSFLQAGHTPTLIAAFLYFDLAFMVWVILGPLGIGIAQDLGLSHAEKGLMVATPVLAGAILAPATVLGENLIRPLFKSLTDQQLLRIMRMSVVGVTVVTGTMAMMRNNIYELVGESSALSLVSLFTPLIAGLYWRRASAAGAMTSMIAGMLVWLVSLYLLPEEPAEDASIWMHIPPMLYGFAAGISGMIIGSTLYPKREVEMVTDVKP